MKIPLSYTISHNIVSLLTKIEANKVLFQALTIPDTLFQNLTHQSLLKSSVFSAQIEGNPLDMDSFEKMKHDQQEKPYEQQEIENIITALSFLRDRGIPENIDLPFLLQLHKTIMNKLVHESQTGIIRKQPGAIFDGNGNVVYITP